jgi:hypothetical protein
MKKTGTNKKKPGVGITAIATRSKAVVAPKTTKDDLQRGPRGGANGQRIAITFRVSREQYRKLTETKLDAGCTIHDVIAKALVQYYDREHGTKF